MLVKVQLSENEYIDFKRLYVDPPILGITISVYSIYALIALIIYGYIVFTLPFEIDNIPSCLIVGFVTVFVPLFYYVYLPWSWRSEFRKNNTLSLPFDIEITDNELRLHNASSNYSHRWEDYITWKEDGRLVLLMQKDKKAIFLPKRIFSAEHMNYLYLQIERHNIPKNIKAVKQSTRIGLIVAMIINAAIVAYIIYMNLTLR